jgi:hypothetical protein
VASGELGKSQLPDEATPGRGGHAAQGQHWDASLDFSEVAHFGNSSDIVMPSWQRTAARKPQALPLA